MYVCVCVCVHTHTHAHTHTHTCRLLEGYVMLTDRRVGAPLTTWSKLVLALAALATLLSPARMYAFVSAHARTALQI